MMSVLRMGNISQHSARNGYSRGLGATVESRGRVDRLMSGCRNCPVYAETFNAQSRD
jgi:hypothetical protein